jgi:hypothetical protein
VVERVLTFLALLTVSGNISPIREAESRVAQVGGFLLYIYTFFTVRNERKPGITCGAVDLESYAYRQKPSEKAQNRQKSL